MQNEYEVPFELTFNSEAEVMNNLFVHDLSVQDEIVISENKVKYLFENSIFLELTYKTTIVSISDEEKKQILSDNQGALFEDAENISTTIRSNKPFKLVLETNVDFNSIENSQCDFSSAYITFS